MGNVQTEQRMKSPVVLAVVLAFFTIGLPGCGVRESTVVV
jgi:hypothetical protein